MRLSFVYGTPVRQLKEIMNSLDFAKCLAYSRIEPIGDKRGDFQAASIAAACHNATVMALGGEPVQINDKLLKFGEPARQTSEEIRSIMISDLMGGK